MKKLLFRSLSTIGLLSVSAVALAAEEAAGVRGASVGTGLAIGLAGMGAGIGEGKLIA